EGISSSCFYRAAAANPEIRERLKRSFEEQRPIFREEAISCIRRAIRKGIWQAALRWLESAYPSEFARYERADMVGPRGVSLAYGQVVVELPDNGRPAYLDPVNGEGH